MNRPDSRNLAIAVSLLFSNGVILCLRMRSIVLRLTPFDTQEYRVNLSEKFAQVDQDIMCSRASDTDSRRPIIMSFHPAKVSNAEKAEFQMFAFDVRVGKLQLPFCAFKLRDYLSIMCNALDS